MVSRGEMIAQVAKLQEAIRDLDGEGKTEMPVEVTVAMVVASDLAVETSRKPIIYLGQTFRALESGSQCVPINVLVCTIEPDTDGANAWLREVENKENKWPASQFKSFNNTTREKETGIRW